MKKLGGILVLLALTGCAVVARQPVPGYWFSDMQQGEHIAGGAAGSRVGEACAESILGAVATGDASIETARRNGGITTITSVDSTAKSYIGIYAKYCTVVRGR